MGVALQLNDQINGSSHGRALLKNSNLCLLWDLMLGIILLKILSKLFRGQAKHFGDTGQLHFDTQAVGVAAPGVFYYILVQILDTQKFINTQIEGWRDMYVNM